MAHALFFSFIPVDYLKSGYYNRVSKLIWISVFGGIRMKKGSKLAVFIGVIAAVAAVVASLSALLLYLDRKRDDKELEHYLDCSIQ